MDIYIYDIFSSFHIFYSLRSNYEKNKIHAFASSINIKARRKNVFRVPLPSSPFDQSKDN